MAEAKCFLCLDQKSMSAVIAALLCQNLRALDPMAECDVSTLMASAKCFMCLDQKAAQAVQLQLLCNLVDASIGGGSGGVICAAEDPVADPGVTCALAYNTVTASLWYWNDNLGIWSQLIGG